MQRQTNTRSGQVHSRRPPPAPLHACTIISRCYLSHAKILADSYFRHEPDGRFYLLVVDRLPDDVARRLDRRIRIVAPQDLRLKYFYELCFKYNVTELCTAVKPSLLAHLLERERCRHLAYFDPDILVARPMDELKAMLAGDADIVLTPHLLHPIPLDGKKPTEQDILRDGAYNMGFVAMRDARTTRAFLRWWEERLRDLCRMDPSNGLFTDQKWIDLVPALFPSARILRDETYNVAYWNLHARKLTRAGRSDRYLVNGRPLAFFHFSGFNPGNPRELSKHQTRTKVRGSLKSLLQKYSRLHARAGFAQSSKWDYGYGAFENGMQVDPVTRGLYLSVNDARRKSFGDPFHVNGHGSFLRWASRPGRNGAGLSPFLRQLYEQRRDVSAVYNDLRKQSQREEFVSWAASQGAIELGYDPRLARGEVSSGTPRAKKVARAARSSSTKLARGREIRYPRLVSLVRRVVAEHVPPSATVAIVSKGDEALLESGGGRIGWHFPCAANGRYAGHYPRNSATAVAHLEALRGKGAHYLVFPQTAFWWLDHYADLRHHLDDRYRAIVQRRECVIYELQAPQPQATPDATPAATREPRYDFGVNLAGYLNSEKGMGEGVRSDMRALMAAKVPLVLNDVVDDGSHNLHRLGRPIRQDNPYPINLLHVNADQIVRIAQEKGEAYMSGRYNIGFWAWELAEFPAVWKKSFANLNEVWVPSAFTLDAVSRVAPVPVIRMPHCIPPKLALRPMDRADFGLPADKYLFLYMYDAHSFVERKNPIGLLRAFRRAFGDRDDVALVLKVAHAKPEHLRAIRTAARGARVILLERLMARAEVNTLMSLADCYVSLHRSEGFGLTCAEAMSLGKPVIATAYSGNTDFMNASNSLPVRYQLTELREDHGPYKRGNVWADPDVDHAAELMRFAYRERRAAKRIGETARRDVLTHLSPAAVGHLMRTRLDQIAAGETGGVATRSVADRSSAAPTTPLSDRQEQYGQTISGIRSTARKVLSRGATVLVVSKGDDSLLKLGRGRARHFPHEADGTYSGYHPADSRAAIALLEQSREGGAQYLLLPSTSFWWLKHYKSFARHLRTRYQNVFSDEACVIFSLAGAESAAVAGDRARKDTARVLE